MMPIHVLRMHKNVAAGGPITGVLATRITSNTSTSPVPWNGEAYDYTGWHDNSTDPSRCTVPAGSGVTLVRVSFCMYSLTAQFGSMQINGAAFRGQPGLVSQVGTDSVNAISGPIAVSAGQYVETLSGGNTAAADEYNWMAVEVLPSSLKYALAYNSVDQPIAANTTTTLDLNSEVQDTDGFHTPATATVTITIASPGVVSWTAHGLIAGDPVVFTTTGALPTGLTAGTIYYVIATGITANSFRVATTPGGSAINTSGSQSGTHTATCGAYLVVPSGVTLVRYIANWVNNTGSSGIGDQSVISSLKNGADFAGRFNRDCSLNGSTPDLMNGVSAILEVTTGDRFSFSAATTSATTVSSGESTWASLEEVPSTIKRCLCVLDAGQAVAAGVPEALTFGAAGEIYDTDSIHEGVTNPSYFTGPPGGTEARISFNVLGTSVSTTLEAFVLKNGAAFYGTARAGCSTSGSDAVNGITAWVPYTPGDNFEVWVVSSAGQTIPAGNITWVCAEFR
jgi:hypothetical protein